MRCYSVPVVGEQHYAANLQGLSDGDRVTFVHEPDNPHDSRAVRVEAKGLPLGYLPRKLWLKRVMIDDGIEPEAVILEIVPADDGVFPEVVLYVNLEGVAMTVDDLPPIIDLPPARYFAPLVNSMLPLTCDCGHGYSTPLKGLWYGTKLKCPSCGEECAAGDDVSDSAREQFIEAFDAICDALDADVPSDVYAEFLMRTGRFPKRELAE